MAKIEKLIDHDRMLVEIETLTRKPFVRELARIMMNAPSDEAIKAQAEKYPDRWGQFVTMLARLAGYNEKIEVVGDLIYRIKNMSDSELRDALACTESETVHAKDTEKEDEEK